MLRRAALFLCALAVSPAAQAKSPARPLHHVVQSGQRLASIAKRYQVRIEDLCAANGIENPNKVKVGTRLIVPNPDGSVPAKARDSQPPASTKSSASPSTPAASSTTARGTKATPTSYAPYQSRPAKPGWVRLVSYHADWSGRLMSTRGALLPQATRSVSRLLAWPRRDFAMDERLIRLLVQVSDTFGGRPLRIVSGYRRSSYSSESRHPLGKACDFSVPGVPNRILRDYLRTLTKVGVGYYPNSSFVHLDVREQTTYWVDYSGPGERPRLRPRSIAQGDGNRDHSGASGSLPATGKNGPAAVAAATPGTAPNQPETSSTDTLPAQTTGLPRTEPGKAPEQPQGSSPPNAPALAPAARPEIGAGTEASAQPTSTG